LGTEPAESRVASELHAAMLESAAMAASAATAVTVVKRRRTGIS
jgi:hypothetical protein